ncbi:MAG: HIT family protein [Coprobacillus sp.]
MDNCIFCKIANHEIPGKILYEDDICMAFLDLSQTTDGHTLIIPKKHSHSFLDTDPDILAHMIKVAQRVANTLIERTNAKGMNIISNMNEVAGQTVHHFHIHLIPRYQESDGIQIHYSDRSLDVDLESIYQKLK